VKQEVTRKENIVVVLVLIAKQHCIQTKVLDDERASSMMSIVSSAGKRQLCSAKQISGGARFDDSQAHATQHALISSTTKRCSRLRRLDECEQLAADRHAARNSGHAPRQRLVTQIGLRSVRERHDRSLEIGAAVVAQQHEHALKHRRVSSRLDQPRSSTSAPLASRNSTTSMAPLRIAASEPAGAVRILKRTQRKIDLSRRRLGE
jgi:hypothetical protein